MSITEFKEMSTNDIIVVDGVSTTVPDNVHITGTPNPVKISRYPYIDQQAFNALYEALQEIGTITQRAIREGNRGYKPALKKIMGICRDVE